MTTHVRVYSAFTRCYPAAFKADYSQDLVDLFRDQLADEPAVRVWARTLRDLAVTVPTLHLESRVKSNPTTVVAFTSGTICISALALALLTGLGGGVMIFGTIAIASGVLAFWSARAAQPESLQPIKRSWWKPAAFGVVLFTIDIIICNIPREFDDLPSGSWYVAMGGILLSIALVATSALMLISSFVGRRRTA